MITGQCACVNTLVDSCLFLAGSHKSRGAALYWRQFWALFLKRAISAKRDSLAAILQILVPILLVLLALEAGNASMTRAQQPVLVISRWVYLF